MTKIIEVSPGDSENNGEVFIVSGTPSALLGVEGDLAIDEDSGAVWLKENVASATYLNPADKGANIVLSGSDLTATITGTREYDSVRSLLGVSSGQYYWELTIVKTSTHPPAAGYATHGVGNISADLAWFVGKDAHGYGYDKSGGKYAGGVWSSYGNSYADGDIISVALDMDAGKIWFAKNGVWQNSGDPIAGTNEAFSGISGTFYSMGSCYYISGDEFIANFGATPFDHTVPAGYANGLGETAVIWVKRFAPDSVASLQAPIDLSGATATSVVFVADRAYTLTAANLCYTEASSADTGVNIEVGKLIVGTDDPDFFVTAVATEISKEAGYRKALTLAQTGILEGDIVTITSAGSKVGTGEVILQLYLTRT